MARRNGALLPVLIVCLGSFLTTAADAQWARNGVRVFSGDVNTGLCGLVSDSHGGAYVVWEADASLVPDRLRLNFYAQRIAPSGALDWGPSGVRAMEDSMFSLGFSGHGWSGGWTSDGPTAFPDARGGLILTWDTFLPETMSLVSRVQRLNGTAQRLYGPEGVTLPGRAGVLQPDGEGGAIILASADRKFAMRLDGAGRILWLTAGLEAGMSDAAGMDACSNSRGGATVVGWDNSPDKIWIRTFESSGADTGSQVRSAPIAISGDPKFVRVVRDGPGAMILVWIEEHEHDSDIRVLRIDSEGKPLWPAPVRLEHASSVWRLVTISDSAGGVIVSWCRKLGLTQNIYAQRLDSTGVACWKNAKRPIVQAEFADWEVVGDQAGGAIFTWSDWSGIRTKRVDRSGLEAWPGGPVSVCDANGFNGGVRGVSDGEGGAIVIWQDRRHDDNAYFAQRIPHDGMIEAPYPPGPPPDGDHLPAYEDTTEVDEFPFDPDAFRKLFKGHFDLFGEDKPTKEQLDWKRCMELRSEFGVLIDKDGHVIETHIARTGPGVENAARKWAHTHWRPARLRGRPVAYWKKLRYAP